MDLKDLLLWSLVPEPDFSFFKESRERYKSFCETNSTFITKDFCNYDHKDEMIFKTETYIKMLQEFIKNKEPLKIYNKEAFYGFVGQYFLSVNAFLSTIQMLGDSNQVQYWTDLVMNGRIIGAYAQTEFAHGSDVQKLETRAEYDENQKSFILNSPKLSSNKLWAGVLGTSATHCVLQAQTYIKGKHIGVQTFVINVRDVKTYQNMPGVCVGDQGPKLGFLGVDNGFMNLKNVKVPVKNLLMRYIHVSEDGIYTPPKDKNAIKYGYGSMLNLRIILAKSFSVSILHSSALSFFQSQKTCISQYQGELQKEGLFLKYVSYGIGYLLASIKLDQIFDQYNQELSRGDHKVKHTLNEIHVLSSSFKALTGWKAVETNRISLHKSPISFLKLSGLPMRYTYDVPFTTYEGDNSVLTQQTARFLLKEIQKLQSDEKLERCTSFFKNYFDNNENILINTVNDCYDMNLLEKLLENFAFLNTKKTAEDFANLIMEGNTTKTVWNEKKLIDLINMSLIFVAVVSFKYAKETLIYIKNKMETKTFEYVSKIINYYGLCLIEEYSQKLILFNLIPNNYKEIINEAKSEILIKSKKALPLLVDACKFNTEAFFKESLIDKGIDYNEKYQEYFSVFTENAKSIAQELNLESKL